MPRVGVTKEMIFSISEKIANGRGYENLTMGFLARELGIRTPSLYKHVRDLEEIREYLAVKGLSLLTANLKMKSRVPGTKALYAMAREYRNFALQNPGLYAAFQKTHVNRSPVVQNEAKKLLELIFNQLTGLSIKKQDLVHAARSLRSCLHGFIALERSGGFGMPGDLDKSFDYMIKNWMRGVSSEFSRLPKIPDNVFDAIELR